MTMATMMPGFELRPVCAEKVGAVHALPGATHPIPEVLRVLEILALVDLFIAEVDPLHVQSWQRRPLAQAERSTKPETDRATERQATTGKQLRSAQLR